jgi:hypothetical protein
LGRLCVQLPEDGGAPRQEVGQKEKPDQPVQKAVSGLQGLRITPYYRENLCRFTQKWRLEREVGGDYLKTEFEAIRNTLDMWDSLPVDGIIICIDRQMVAYSIFSPQTKCMATIHFEKYDPTKKGSGQLINWETARYLNQEYKWLNREQDIGLPGLRQAKNSYMPDRMIKFIKGELK